VGLIALDVIITDASGNNGSDQIGHNLRRKITVKGLIE